MPQYVSLLAVVARAAALAALLCGVSIAAGAAPIDSRETAPGFRAKTLDGEELSNESLKGKVVLVQFWATWCPICRRDQPAVETLTREFEKEGLVVLAVDVGESKNKVRAYLAESPRSCKLVANEDTNLPAIFAAHTYPLYVLIDRAGKIAGIQRGGGGEAPLRRLLAHAGLDSK